MKETVLITGTSSGFGRETAKIFQKNGWNVIASMRSTDEEQELKNLDNVLIVQLDVQDTGSIKAAVEAGIKKFGKIDALINNAGYAVMGIFEQTTEEQIKNQYDVNVFGMMRVTHEVLPFMRKNGKGAIVNVSSIAGVVGFPFASIYESSKFAVEGFSEALHFELFKLGIRVSIIEPGSVKTNFGNAKDMAPGDAGEYQSLMAAFYNNYPKKTVSFSKATPAGVAETIYKAATEHGSKLRYVVGEDSRFFIDTKLKTTEETYLKAIKDFFN